jgi:hypothetical protein
MPDQEIVDKLTNLVVFGKYRIEGLLGEGKEKVVLRAVVLNESSQGTGRSGSRPRFSDSDADRVVLKLYRSNPMFLLNEVDFEFLPLSGNTQVDVDRFISIAEKVVDACDRPHPGLFFWHIQALYGKILTDLCRDFSEYGVPVIDTSTLVLQNSELAEYARTTLSRVENLGFLDLEPWEVEIRPLRESLKVVSEFLTRRRDHVALEFSTPTALLAVVFCEGFFGTIPRNEGDEKGERGQAVLGNLTRDPTDVVPAESTLGTFLNAVDYGGIIADYEREVGLLAKALEALRGMAAVDASNALDRVLEQALAGMVGKSASNDSTPDDFTMRYNAGRNTLLRGLPRFVRVLTEYQS